MAYHSRNLLLDYTNTKVVVPNLWQGGERTENFTGEAFRNKSDRVTDFLNVWLSRLSTAIQSAKPRREKVVK